MEKLILKRLQLLKTDLDLVIHKKVNKSKSCLGSYQVNEVSAPYSGRGSVGFISNTDRSSYPKIRKSVNTKRINNKQSLPIQESSSYAEMFENKDEDEEDEYVKVRIFSLSYMNFKDATPGPGYYYNASTASSFRTRTTATNSLRSKRSDMERSRSKSHRETKSRTGKGMNERFHERTSAASEIGPGEYQGLSNFVKKVDII